MVTGEQSSSFGGIIPNSLCADTLRVTTVRLLNLARPPKNAAGKRCCVLIANNGTKRKTHNATRAAEASTPECDEHSNPVESEYSESLAPWVFPRQATHASCTCDGCTRTRLFVFLVFTAQGGGEHVSPGVPARLGTTTAPTIALAHTHVIRFVFRPYVVHAANERRWCMYKY